MRNSLLKSLLASGTLFATSFSLWAIEPPTLPIQEPVAGEKYILFNKARPDGFMTRTSWDGALRYGTLTDSNYANHELEAVKNEDGSWSFIQTIAATEEGAEPTIEYLVMPDGNPNLNIKSTQASWNLAKGDYEGYYKLIAGEGNNYPTIGLLLHLNNGQEYFVISYPGAPYYPDFAVKTDEDGNQVYDETGVYLQMADSTSTNWAFVKTADVAVYGSKQSAYTTINNYELAWLTTAGFETGFQVGADAITAIYTNEAFDETYPDSISAIVNAKVALYQEIVKATEANTSADATLAAAIQAAQKVFDESAVALTLNEAVVTLVKAEDAYGQGLGDYTSLGKNMSFEDLSAQGGATTVNIGNTPTGWNLYLNGVLSQTIEEIQANGIATGWVGVNADCTGAAKDGEMGYGIWTPGFPAVELSQTIENIENGTYEISVAMMVGANSNGSRRTTQRLFGNLNSTYFGGMADYDLSLLDNSEVYDFANLVEPVTDTEMQLVTCRAYVYEGKLTFGFRTDNNVAAANRTSSNASGGDGWFKIDNFRIQKVGYQAEDALNVLTHYSEILDGYYYDAPAIYEETYNLLKERLEEFEGFTKESAQEDINKAIISAKELLAIIEPGVKAYEELAEAITAAYEGHGIYSSMPGADAYLEFIIEVESNFSDGIYPPEEIPSIIQSLEEALEVCKKSEISVGKDITYLLTNPSFEDIKASQPGGDNSGIADTPKGWTLILNGDTCRTAAEITAHNIANWCAINGGDPISVELSDGTVVTQQPTEGSKLWGIWTKNIPEVELSQVITGLPQGTYTLTADVMVQYNWAGDNLTTQRIFANDYVQMFSYNGAYNNNMPTDALNANELDLVFQDESYPFLTYAGYTCTADDPTTSLLHTMKVKFVVDESGTAKIGFRTNGVNPDGTLAGEGGRDGQGWFKVDNFTLFYNSTEMPTSIEKTEINNNAATVVSSQYYTIDGVEIAAPQQGINIVKSILSDGTVKVNKLLVK